MGLATLLDSEVEQWATHQFEEKLRDESAWIGLTLESQAQRDAHLAHLSLVSKALSERVLQLHTAEGERIWPPDSPRAFAPSL